MHTFATRLSTAIAASWLLMLPAAAAPNVVVSIKPIQSLTAALMQNVSTPSLIVDNNDSPHTFSLRPSDAQSLQSADLVVWVGPELEAFLPKALETAEKIGVERVFFTHINHDLEHESVNKELPEWARLGCDMLKVALEEDGKITVTEPDSNGRPLPIAF